MSYPPTIETILKPLVASTRALPGWSFDITNSDTSRDPALGEGYQLEIEVHFEDSYHPGHKRGVIHCFLVPNASYDYRAWRKWLFDQCMLVQQHELAEFFRQQVPNPHTNLENDFIEFKPFRPHHGHGRNPYQVLEVGTEEDAQMQPGELPNGETAVWLTFVAIDPGAPDIDHFTVSGEPTRPTTM